MQYNILGAASPGARQPGLHGTPRRAGGAQDVDKEGRLSSLSTLSLALSLVVWVLHIVSILINALIIINIAISSIIIIIIIIIMFNKLQVT